jgi:Mn-dependent DtxR family transcriptional regulator
MKMNRNAPSVNSRPPTLSASFPEEVLQYLQGQGGEVKETAIYIHFVLDHHEEISEILEELAEDGFIQHKGEGHMTLTRKGKKALFKQKKQKP